MKTMTEDSVKVFSPDGLGSVSARSAGPDSIPQKTKTTVTSRSMMNQREDCLEFSKPT